MPRGGGGQAAGGYDDVNKIVDRYKDKYKLYLVGEDLGNFHVDLPPLYKDNEVYGIESYCLGEVQIMP